MNRLRHNRSRSRWAVSVGVALTLAGLLAPAAATASPTIVPAALSAAPAGFDIVSQDVAPHTATVTVALVAPPGTTPNFSRDDAQRAAEQAAEYLRIETDGKVTVEIAQVTDWMFPTTESPCSWNGVWQDFAAAQLGWEPGPGRHLSVMVPEGAPCPDWANGDQGWSLTAGGRTFQPGFDSSTLAHEWGHNMSMAHAFSTACPTWDFRATDGRTPGECERKEYGNRLDTLGGAWTLTPLSSPSLDRIGVLPQKLVPRCGAPVTATTGSAADGAAGRGTITWESTVEPGVRYWVDYRDANASAKYAYLHVGYWAFTPGTSGLQILRTDPEVPFGATVLERPGDSSDGAQLVNAGERVTLTDGTVVSWAETGEGTSRADITIDRPCAVTAQHTAPTVKIDATATTRKIGGRVYLTVSAVNRNEVPATIGITSPYGTKKFVDVAPGKKASVSFNSGRPAVPAGEATITATATLEGTATTGTTTVGYPAHP